MIRISCTLIVAVLLSGALSATAKEPARANYASVRAVVVRLHDMEQQHSAAPLRDERAVTDLRRYIVDDCETHNPYVGRNADARTAEYGDIAYVVVKLERDLPEIGYPPNVWRERIRRFEGSEIAGANNATLESQVYYRRHTYSDGKLYAGYVEHTSRYIRDLDLFRARLLVDLGTYWRTHRTLPRAVSGMGCGAGEFPMKIATEPKGGQVFLIATFFYELCKVKKINPEDTAGCKQWREALDTTMTDVSGDYHYRVRWHDGTVRRGMLRADGRSSGGGRPGQVETVTIRKP